MFIYRYMYIDFHTYTCLYKVICKYSCNGYMKHSGEACTGSVVVGSIEIRMTTSSMASLRLKHWRQTGDITARDRLAKKILTTPALLLQLLLLWKLYQAAKNSSHVHNLRNLQTICFSRSLHNYPYNVGTIVFSDGSVSSTQQVCLSFQYHA